MSNVKLSVFWILCFGFWIFLLRVLCVSVPLWLNKVFTERGICVVRVFAVRIVKHLPQNGTGIPLKTRSNA